RRRRGTARDGGLAMPKWLSRRPQPPEKPVPSVPPPSAKTPPVKTPVSPEPSTAAQPLEEAIAVQARLRQDLAELLKAHRQQGRVLERNQKLLEQTEEELSRHRGRAAALESEVAELRSVADQHAARVQELEQVAAKHATLQTAYETVDR